jgi:hypothetical protein
MAEKSEFKRSTDNLIAKAARSRERVERDLRDLRYELDFQRKFRESFQEHTPLWLTAATAVGVLIVLLPTRKKKIYVRTNRNKKTDNKFVESGVALGTLNILVGLIRPALVEFVKNRLTRGITRVRTKDQ